MSSFEIQLDTGVTLEGDEADGYFDFLAAEALEVENDGDYPEAVTALAEAARAKVRLSTHINGDVYRVTSKRLYDEVLIPLVEDASSSG